MTEDQALLAIAVLTGSYGTYVFFNTWKYCRAHGEQPLKTSLKWGLGSFLFGFVMLSVITMAAFGHRIVNDDEPIYRGMPGRR